MHYTTKLFAKTRVKEYFEKRRTQAVNRVKSKSVRKDSVQEEWTSYFLKKFKLEPIVLDLEHRKLEYQTRSGNKELLYIMIKVPYTASKGLVDLRPNDYKIEQLPSGKSGNSYMTLFFQADIFDSNDVHRSKYENTINTLLECVEVVNKEVTIFNNWLDNDVLPIINERFAELKRIEEVANIYR